MGEVGQGEAMWPHGAAGTNCNTGIPYEHEEELSCEGDGAMEQLPREAVESLPARFPVQPILGNPL